MRVAQSDFIETRLVTDVIMKTRSGELSSLMHSRIVHEFGMLLRNDKWNW